jgi:hypothetical protein
MENARGVVRKADAGEIGGPFAAGPFAGIPHPWPLAPACHRAAWQRALTTVTIAWAPLMVLSAGECLIDGATLRQSVLFDAAAIGRYFVASPAFASAGAFALPQLAHVVEEFRSARLIAEHDRPRFEALVTSTRALLASRWADAALLGLAYVLTIVTSSRLYPAERSTWVLPGAGGIAGHLSLAGWWRLAVSQPLFNALLGVWLWRLLLWIRFLWQTTRLDLRLVATHPDLLGGLRFTLVPLRGFAVLAFGFGAIAAGSVTDSVLVGGQPLSAFSSVIGLQVLGVLLLLAGPALLLMGPLARLQIWGTFHYGELASYMGHEFQERWLGDRRPTGIEALAAPDFSATTDLYSISANVRLMNWLVLEPPLLLMLCGATLLPYVPVVFAVMPIDKILQFALKALA